MALGVVGYRNAVLAIVGWFLYLCGPSLHHASAQGLSPIEIQPHGKTYQLTLTPEQVASRTVSLYFISPGNVSTAVGLLLEGPAGVRASAHGVALSGKYADVLAALDQSHNREIAEFRGKDGKGYDQFEIGGSGGSVQMIYHLHKDACLEKKGVRYASLVTLDLSRVDPSSLSAGFSARIAIQELPFPGSQVASIKPSSDGKYRGEPILLMGTVSYGGEFVNIIQRRSQRVSSRRKIPVVKYVTHRGHSLSLARLRGVLNGGIATMELSNGGYVYGVCFRLVRRRQVANGYPL